MVKLQVSDMSCMSCVHNIQDEISEIDPEVKITADVRKRKIEVNSILNNETLVLLIKKAGYNATVVTE